jgi:hypothetical protein
MSYSSQVESSIGQFVARIWLTAADTVCPICERLEGYATKPRRLLTRTPRALLPERTVLAFPHQGELGVQPGQRTPATISSASPV